MPNFFDGNTGGNTGVVQRLLASGGDMSILRTNGVLQERDWIDLDKRIVRLSQERLTLVSDLVDSGLVHNLGGIGTTMAQWQTESDMTAATLSMEADSEDNRSLLDYGLEQVPVPIIHKDFRLGFRQLQASRDSGSNIDMTNADAAARKVAIGVEELFIKGSGASFNGQTIYGITTHPNRITGQAVGSWDDADNILATIEEMLEDASTAHQYGSFNLYIPANKSMAVNRFYADGSGQTVLERILKLSMIKKVSVNDRLPDGNISLVQMSSETIDAAVAQPVIPVEWEEKGGMAVNYKVLTAITPRIKPNANGELGIVHYIGA